MIGFLDHVRNGEITGWALDPDAPNEPVTVSVLVNGRSVATALAARHREDVSDAYGTKGYHGFCVDLFRCVPPARHVVIEARASDGCMLGNSPLSVSVPVQACSETATLVFMHIPKTGGTALIEAIGAVYSESQKLYIYPDDNFYPANIPIWSLPLDQRARLRLIVGHIGVGIHQALPQECDYIAFVRRPLERIISQYLHYVYRAPHVITNSGRVMSLCEVLERCPEVSFDNVMTRYFAGVDLEMCPIGTVNEDVFRMARNNLHRHFIYVGTQNDSYAGYEVLKQLFQWGPAPDLGVSNVAAGALESDEIEQARAVVKDTQRWDALLYDEVTDLFRDFSISSVALRGKERRSVVSSPNIDVVVPTLHVPCAEGSV